MENVYTGKRVTRYKVNEALRDGTVEQGRNLWDDVTAFGFCAYLNKEHSGRKFYVKKVKCIVLTNGTLAVE